MRYFKYMFETKEIYFPIENVHKYYDFEYTFWLKEK